MKRSIIFLFLIGVATLLSSPAQAGFFDRLFSNNKNGALKIRSNQAPATTRGTEGSQPMSVKSFTNQNTQNVAPFLDAANAINNLSGKDIQPKETPMPSVLDFIIEDKISKHKIRAILGLESEVVSLTIHQNANPDFSSTTASLRFTGLVGEKGNNNSLSSLKPKACENGVPKISMTSNIPNFTPLSFTVEGEDGQTWQEFFNNECGYYYYNVGGKDNVAFGEAFGDLLDQALSIQQDEPVEILLNIEGHPQYADQFMIWKKQIKIFIEKIKTDSSSIVFSAP